MQESIVRSKIMRPQHKYLWFLTLSYCMVIVFANWFDLRLIHLVGLDTDAGTLVFPLTFLLSDIITEVYGYKYARRAIWCGLLFNALFIVYGQIVIHMPSPHYPTNNALFDTILSANIRIIFASAVSYLTAEPLNSYVMAKLKIKMNGKYLGIRFVTSTIFAAGVDSFIFGFIAFYAVISNANLQSLILSMWFIKVLIEVSGLPVSIRLSKKMKNSEKLDIYDRRTSFNLFSLDTEYSEKDNEFSKGET